MIRVLTLLILLCANVIWAHPHVWLESRLVFKPDSVDVVWEFDEMFSNIFYSDFDIDGDRQFIGMEAQRLKSDMFDNLVNFDYFVRAYCGNSLMDIDGVRDFKLSSDGRKVSYHFTLLISLDKCREKVQFYNFDDSMYTDITVLSAAGNGASLKDDVGGRKFVELK